MKLLLLIGGLFLLTSALAEDKFSIDNDIDVKSAVSKINPDVRRALIRAIDNLQQQQALNSSEEDNEEDEDLEESTSPDQSLSAYSANKQELLKNLIAEAAKRNPQQPNDEPFRIDLGTNIMTISRSITASSSNSLSDDKKSQEIDRRKAPTTTTTVAPTPKTTKKPAPTHNADGENIEVVKQQDIKIFEAPLVTAFTVQQDSMGMPKKVIPLIQRTATEAPAGFPPSGPVLLHPHNNPIIPPPVVSPENTVLSPVASAPTAPTLQSPNQQPQPSGSSPTATTLKSIQYQLPTPSFLRSERIQQQQQQNFQQRSSGFSPQALQQQSVQPLAANVQAPKPTTTFTVQKSESFVPPPQPPAFHPQPQPQPQASSNSVFASPPQNINNFLYERQKLLEEQIFFLQAQARQQQEHILIQQQLLQDQQRKHFEEQNRLKLLQQQQQLQASNSLISSNLVSNSQNPQFQFSPDLQLPVREAVNFHDNFSPFPILPQRNSVQIQPSKQFSYIAQPGFQSNSAPVPPELASYPQPPQRNFQPFNPSSQQSTGLPQIPPPEPSSQRTRVFRHETGTGNFGVNNQVSPNTFIRATFSPAQVPVDNQIQNLLFQSGIPSKQHEDVSIISKILALNHGINTYAPQMHYNPGQFRAF